LPKNARKIGRQKVTKTAKISIKMNTVKTPKNGAFFFEKNAEKR